MGSYQAKPLTDREQSKANLALANLAKAQEDLAFEKQFQGPRNQAKIDALELKVFKLSMDADRWSKGQYGHKIVKQDTKALERAEKNLAESSKGMAERMGLPFLKDKFLKALERGDQGIELLEWDGETLFLHLDNETKVDALAWSGLEANQAYKVLETATAG